MDAGAILLWPEVEDLYTLMCMRIEGGQSAFEREKQNSPTNPDLCEWPESYFDESIWFETWPENLIVKTMALDPSKGTNSRRGDYSAFVTLGVDRQGIIHIEADLARRPAPQIVADGVERYRLFRPHIFGIEANQFQDLFAGQFESEFRRLGVLAPNPYPIENTVPKQVRIRRLGSYLSTRRFRFKSNSPSTSLLVEQLKQFPIADHDDGPDALEMAIRLAEEYPGRLPIRRRPRPPPARRPLIRADPFSVVAVTSVALWRTFRRSARMLVRTVIRRDIRRYGDRMHPYIRTAATEQSPRTAHHCEQRIGPSASDSAPCRNC